MNGWKPWKLSKLGRGIPYGPPPFLFRHILMPCLVGLVWSHAGGVMSRWGKGIKATKMLAAWVPLWVSRIILHQSKWWLIIEELDTEGYVPISYPSGLATMFHGSVSRCGGCPVCYLMVSMGWCLSLHQMHMWSLSAILSMKMSTSTSHGLGTSPIFSGCSSWHPSEKP